MLNFLFQLDTQLFFLINHLPHNLFLDDFFGLLSFVGEYGAVWFVLTFLLFLKNLASQGSTLRSYEARKLTVVWLTGLISLALVFFLKEIFRQPRPEFVLQNVILPFASEHSFSFPSGHALVSFTFAYLLTNSTQRLPRRLRLLAMTGFYFLAVLISFSRVYLGYHYAGDVIGGAILGTLIGMISFVLLRRGCRFDKNNSNTVIR